MHKVHGCHPSHAHGAVRHAHSARAQSHDEAAGAGPGDRNDVSFHADEESHEDDHPLVQAMKKNEGWNAASLEKDPLKASVMATEGLTRVDHQDTHLGYALQALQQGNQEGKWAMPYLENIARQSWNGSPTEAPPGYVNKWIESWASGSQDMKGAAELNQALASRGLQNPGPQAAAAPAAPAVAAPAATADPGKQQMGQMLTSSAQKYGIPPNVLEAIAYHESHWDPQAVGDNGASHGAMQIYSGAHPDYDVARGQADPAYNIDYAAHMLAGLAQSHGGDWAQAARAYNGSGPAAEAYSAAVMQLAQQRPWVSEFGVA